MDTILSIVTGLGLRLFLGRLDEGLGRVSPVLLGLWEGAVVHHLSNNASSFDQYLAYGLRMAIDLLFTENLSRMLVVLLWTGLGLVASQAISPTSRRESKRDRRHRTTHSVPSHIQVYQSPATPQVMQNAPNLTPLNFPSRNLGQHLKMTPPSRPPSPPSFFLQGEFETESNSPLPQPRYLQSAFVGDDSPSPPLPTPSPTLITGDFNREVSDPLYTRLSTIPEVSGVEDTTPVGTDLREEHLGLPGSYIGPSTSYPPSTATVAPLPIPNSTIRYDWNQNPVLPEGKGEDEDAMYAPSMVASAPLPVPNAETKFSKTNRGPATPSELDELRTPNAVNLELTDQDELRTPIAFRKELSPLFSDQNIPLDFGTTKAVEFPVEITPIPTTIPTVDENTDANTTSHVPVPIPTKPVTTTVEYFSIATRDPVSDKLSETESAQTETEATSVVSIRDSTQLYSKAELLRKQARQEEREYHRLKQEYSIASSEARIKDTLFLRADMRDSEKRSKKLHERAARRFFAANNSLRNPRTVDVHGLRVAEAIEMTENTLRHALTNGHSSVRVIVGKGLHSAGKIPVLKGAIIRAMEGQKIPCRTDPSNSGVLILSLSPS